MPLNINQLKAQPSAVLAHSVLDGAAEIARLNKRLTAVEAGLRRAMTGLHAGGNIWLVNAINAEIEEATK